MTQPEPRQPGDAEAAARRLTMDYPVEIEFLGEPAEEDSPPPPEPAL